MRSTLAASTCACFEGRMPPKKKQDGGGKGRCDSTTITSQLPSGNYLWNSAEVNWCAAVLSAPLKHVLSPSCSVCCPPPSRSLYSPSPCHCPSLFSFSLSASPLCRTAPSAYLSRLHRLPHTQAGTSVTHHPLPLRQASPHDGVVARESSVLAWLACLCTSLFFFFHRLRVRLVRLPDHFQLLTCTASPACLSCFPARRRCTSVLYTSS